MDQKQNQGQQEQDQRDTDQQSGESGQAGTQSRERGMGSSLGERNRSSEGRSSGISNRDMDTELSEQEELPERGSGQSER
jgi:hypothetical protein